MEKMATAITVLLLFVMFFSANAQVRTDLNNVEKITTNGKFNKAYKTSIDFEVPKKDIKELLEKEKADYASTNYDKPFRLATAIPVDIDITRQIKWSFENEFAYGKFSLLLNGALSTSVNFDKFMLPPNTEMYIYNENGNMITGPITEKENNPNNVWGSWVYKGEYLNIEIKTPVTTYKELVMHTNNIAYGYKHVYQIETAGFGTSESCNINVICPLGTGWEAERNSVALVLNDNGEDWCSGAMIMNTCNTNRPFFLTANHCFTGQNVSAWRFMFQAWSPTCPHPGINSNGVTYNGSTLRANWGGTDFCLVELNNTPPANSGINYSGWNRNTAAITQTTIIHHPQGDVMKISRDNQAPVFDNFSGAQCWRLGLDQGATQGGSSGSPYYDQNHRIIGQHYGIDDGNLPVCSRSRKFGGRFDLSWTGGGTNATRLSNWLDPNNTGAFATNTTNVNNLATLSNITISGNAGFCSSGLYSVTGAPVGAAITWSALPAGSVNFSCNPCAATAISQSGSNSGKVTITATVNICGFERSVSKVISVGLPNANQFIIYSDGPNVCPNVPVDFGAFYSTPDFCTIAQTGATTIEWSVSPTPLQIIYNSGNGVCPGVNSAGIEISFANQGYNYQATVRFRTQNACGWSNWSNNYIVNVMSGGMCGGFIYSVFPNPTTGIVTIQVDDKLVKSSGEENFSISKIRVFDQIGNLKKEWSFGQNSSQVQINTFGLIPGTYTIEVFNSKNKSERHKLLVSK